MSNTSNTASTRKSLFARMFAEPDPKPTIQNKEVIKSKYAFWQISIFISLYALYFISYLGRKSLGVAIHPMESAFQLNNSIYGNLMAVYYFTYCIGKFLGGIIADKANVRVALPLSIGVSSLLTAGIGLSGDLFLHGMIQSKMTMLVMMFISWGLAGFIQAAAFPLCGKTLTFWYSNKKRSFIWSWWSTSHELGSAASLGIAGLILAKFVCWQYVFYIPAAISFVVCTIALFTLRDKPVTTGLPNVEEYRGTVTVKKEESTEPKDDRTYWQVFKEELLCNRNIWLMGGTFFFVYILRMGPMDWLPKQYMEATGTTSGIFKVLLIPIMGCIGSLTIPLVSKVLFKDRRAPAIFTYLMTGAVALIGVRLTSSYEGVKPIIDLAAMPVFKNIVDFILMALIGISTYGPLVLVGGIASIESASKRVAAAATGFTGSLGYVGAIVSSLYLGKMVDKFGFASAANLWIFAAIVGACLCLPMWNVKANKDYSH